MKTCSIAWGAIAAAALGICGCLPPADQHPVAPEPAAAANQGREADDSAIRKTAKDFTEAFNKADAKAVAAQWTEQGECQEANGETIRGRAAIEKSFADFFRDNAGAKIEVRITSIRFPAPDLAIEDGILRLDRGSGEPPSSTVYSTTHVRTQGQWRVAVSKEWGAGVDRIEDLDWLVGTWKATSGDQEMTLSFTADTDSATLHGRFKRTAQGKVVASGTMRIAFDPQAGQVRSWHFDDDGGHGQALWARDGSNWILDSVGVLGDKTDTAAVNILRRVGENEITWRSIDRVAADKPMPDTVPLKLTRVPVGK